jgi:hypothetical protein
MAQPSLTADLWVTDDLTAKVSTNTDLAAVYLDAPHQTIVTFYANSGMARGADKRLADLTVLRNLARRMLIACETALAEGRDKAAAADTVSLGSPDYQPPAGENLSGDTIDTGILA